MSDAAPGAIEAICAYVAERTGTNLSRQQRERLARAAGEALGQRDALAFAEHLRSREGARELAELMSVISVHKTDLFRDEQQLSALKEHVLRTLAATGRPLRLWSAGCSTGEEVATLLILLAEVGAHAASSVLGTDIAPAALAAARRLTFGDEAMRRVPPPVRQRWFTAAPEGAGLVPELAARARFQQHNLMDTPYPFADDGELFDVIVCRNVFIYFTPEAVDRAVGLFAERLEPGGVLVLSAAEPILQARRDLETRRLKTAFFYVRPGRRSSAPASPTGLPAARSRASALSWTEQRGSAPEPPSPERAAPRGPQPDTSPPAASPSSESSNPPRPGPGGPTHSQARARASAPLSSTALAAASDAPGRRASAPRPSTDPQSRIGALAEASSTSRPHPDNAASPSTVSSDVSSRNSGLAGLPSPSPRTHASPPRASAPGAPGTFLDVHSGTGALADTSSTFRARTDALPPRAGSPGPSSAFSDVQTRGSALSGSAAMPGEPSPRPSAPSLASTRPITGEFLVPLTPEAEGRQLFELVLDWAAAGEPEAETEAGLRKALYLAPELAAARYMLGLLLEQRQARADAAAEYRRALALVDTGRAMPSAFFLNNERLGTACRIALARLGYR